jgi:hypothetical protein
VVEYLAALGGPMAGGEASVKLIYAEDPVKALGEYYEREGRAAEGKRAGGSIFLLFFNLLRGHAFFPSFPL